MPDNLPANWAAHWAADPHREVLRAPGGLRLSGAEFADRTAALAGRYAAAGLTPGDRVLMSAAPSVDLVLAHVAALRYGLTVVPANTGYTAPELAHLVADARPVLAVLDDPSRAAGLPATTPDLATLPSGQSTVDGLDRAAAGDPALIVYTSGTTGTPKGAVLSHANLLASARSVGTAWHWHADDRLVLSLPLFHVHGLGVGLYGTLTAGASLVLLPAFDPGAV